MVWYKKPGFIFYLGSVTLFLKKKISLDDESEFGMKLTFKGWVVETRTLLLPSNLGSTGLFTFGVKFSSDSVQPTYRRIAK